MSFFANTWINLDIKNASNTVIVRHLFGTASERVVKPISIPQDTPSPKHLKSAYFRDMITTTKHMKSHYSKDEVTKKHKKSSYVKEFVSDK